MNPSPDMSSRLLKSQQCYVISLWSAHPSTLQDNTQE